MLSNALGVLTAEEKSLEQLHQARIEWEQKLQEAAQNAVPLSELQTIQQYLDFLLGRIASKMKDVNVARTAVEHSRMALADKMKDEKVWLKAKDHALERFRYAMQIKEQNELDEMATVRFLLPTQV